MKNNTSFTEVPAKHAAVSDRRSASSVVLRVLTVGAAAVTSCILLFLISYILVKGLPHLTPELFSPKFTSENNSLLPALINTVFMTVLSLLMAVPLGIGAAVYMTEYARRGSRLVRVVRMAAETLSGIPSIVYGLFGYLCFVVTLHFGYSLLAGACTLTIMVLPLIMRTTEEALISVPDSFREGSFGLGAGRLRTVMKIVLPAAVPGILSGVILAIGRIVGETAALIYTSGTYTEICTDLMQSGRTLSVHMYSLSREGLYIDQAYATAVVLLILVVGINALSSLVAHKISSRAQGK